MKLLIQKGLSSAALPKQRRKTNSVVIAKSINVERDEECNVPLSEYNLNYVFEPKDSRDKKLKTLLKEIQIKDLPATVDLSQDGAWGDMLDQGDIGSCVANSVSYCIRYVRQKHKTTVYDPSRLFIYYYGRVVENFPISEDTGLYIRSGYKSVAKYSVCSERNWPYIPYRFAVEPNAYAISAAKQHKTFEYFSIDHDLFQLKKCLVDGYPISFGFTVFDSFMSSHVAKTGKVSVPKYSEEEESGGHCMTIVGYDDESKCFKVANSWGKKWGLGGFCLMPYEFIMNENYVGDFWSPRRFN